MYASPPHWRHHERYALCGDPRYARSLLALQLHRRQACVRCSSQALDLEPACVVNSCWLSVVWHCIHCLQLSAVSLPFAFHSAVSTFRPMCSGWAGTKSGHPSWQVHCDHARHPHSSSFLCTWVYSTLQKGQASTGGAALPWSSRQDGLASIH